MSQAQPALLSVFATFRVGGPQIRFCAIANHFGRQYRHFIFAMDGAYDCLAHLDRTLDVTKLSVPHRKGDTIFNRSRFRSELKRLNPNLLITHNWGSIEWGMANYASVVPHIHIEDGFGPEEADHQIGRRVWIRRLVLRNRTIIVPSRLLERIALDIWRLRPARINYVPNGIDLRRFANPQIEPLVRTDGVPVIGTVAALRPEKNLTRLLDAFRIVRAERDCVLVIAGDGGERARLEARARELGLAEAVRFTGHLKNTERVYASLDVFVLSSDTEQMPTSVIEAMAAGLPIAGTNVGDVRQMISAENESFIVERDATALASAILGLLAHPRHREIGDANRAAASRNFSETQMFDIYGRLFARTMARSPDTGSTQRAEPG